MAKVVVEEDSVDIRVSLLERVMLAEKPRKLPLSRIRAVDPHPRLIDMMMHWAEQSGVWLCGVCAYDGHLIPSARNPTHTLAIDVGDERERIYVEVDDEPTDHVAERIQRALRNSQGFEETQADEPQEDEEVRARRAAAQAALAKLIEEDRRKSAEYDLDEDDEDDEDVQLRDPLMQGSLPPPPMMLHGRQRSEPAPAVRLEDDRDLARVGGWLVALGSLGVLTGTTIVAAGLVPGLIAVGAGVACGVLGGVALAVVAHHQD